MNCLSHRSISDCLRLAVAGLLLVTLLSACGKPDKPTINLYRAVHADDINQIKRNLYWGADINKAGPDGDYPIHVAARRGNRVIVQMLLKNGAKSDSRNSKGETPLYAALMQGRIQTVELLIKYQAAFDPDKLLLEVARNGVEYKDVIRFLLKRGADINTQGSSGNTPLHIAISGGHRVLVKQLLTRDADINIRNSAGKTPLQLANESGNEIIVKLLRQYGAT